MDLVSIVFSSFCFHSSSSFVPEYIFISSLFGVFCNFKGTPVQLFVIRGCIDKVCVYICWPEHSVCVFVRGKKSSCWVVVHHTNQHVSCPACLCCRL